MTSTLMHIGAPKPEGYFPPQSQGAPVTTTAGKTPNLIQNQAQKETAPSGKNKTQGKSQEPIQRYG
ncbi:MAG: hypothetical protein FJ147_28010 [Deltaproteobacteria bacterium]|nr:hypothetical protein [Deltaproteobacteria bacterium]